MKKWWTFDSKVGEDKRREEPRDVSWWNWHPQGKRCQGQVPKVKSILKVKEKQVLALWISYFCLKKIKDHATCMCMIFLQSLFQETYLHYPVISFCMAFFIFPN